MHEIKNRCSGGVLTALLCHYSARSNTMLFIRPLPRLALGQDKKQRRENKEPIFCIQFSLKSSEIEPRVAVNRSLNA